MPKPEILWEPNRGPQTTALRASPDEFFEIGYGGRRGGGKTAAGIAWLLYDKDHPLLRALIIRKQSEDLKDWVDRARAIYEPLGAVFKGSPVEVHWPSGAIFRTGHLKDANAYGKYVGHEYQRMLIEELNLIPTEENYLKLISSCRSTVPDLRPQVMSNFNPSDAGFYWIRRRFGLEGIPKRAIVTTDETTGLRRIFVPAGIHDNPFLDKDPQYNAFLNGLPDGLREAWRDGSWDEPIIKGAYYTYALAQARNEKRIGAYPYDPSLKVHTVWDLGVGENLVCGFFQRTAGRLALIDTWQGEGSDGLPEAAKMLQEKGYVYGRHFAPHDASKTETGTGKTITQQAEQLGIHFEPVPSVGVTDGINKALMLFPRLVVNERNAETFLAAARSYRKKWDEQRLDWSPEPYKDWSSHYADMLRYTALVEDQMTNETFVMPPATTGAVKPFYPNLGV